VQRARGRLGKDGALVAQALSWKQHLLVGEQCLAPAAAGAGTEADGFAAAQRATAIHVFAEVTLAAAAS